MEDIEKAAGEATNTLRQLRDRLYKQVADWVYTHPDDTFVQIGMKFGIHDWQVSRIAREYGNMAPRKRGRKKGISPKKAQQ